MSKNREYPQVEQVSRDALLEEWRSDPKAVIQQADESNLGSLGAFVNTRAPASKESPGSTTEYLLYNEGIRVIGDDYRPASLMSELPDLAPESGSREPLAGLIESHVDDCYMRAKMTGMTSRAISTYSSNIASGKKWRPRVDDMTRRSPNIAVNFDFRELVAFSMGVMDDVFRTNQWNNDSNEQMMQAVAEGSEPKLFEITRSDNENKLIEYRAGIEATDSFLTGVTARMDDWVNAVEEIGIGHRLSLLRTTAKIANDNKQATYTTTGTIAGVSHTQNVLKYPFWSRFLKTFGVGYNPNACIGNEKSITDFENLSITDGTNLTLGSIAQLPGARYRSLNQANDDFVFGWIDNVTELVDSKLTVFDRNRALGHVYRMNYTQDATVRDEPNRKVQRWLGTQEAVVLLDKYAIREIDYSTS